MNKPFARETDLCAILAPTLNRLLGRVRTGEYARVFRHRSVGRVIPDFLYMSAEKAIQPGLSRGLSSFDASIVATLLQGRPLKTDAIARLLYCRREHVAMRLQVLEKRGILESVEGGLFCLRSKLSWWSVRVVAVEAKLRRWREAILQAASYLPFANQAFVALPSAVVDGNNNLAAAAAKAGVGVIAVGDHGALIAADAPISAASSADWVWLLSRTVGLPARPSSVQASTSLQRISEKHVANHADGSLLCVG